MTARTPLYGCIEAGGTKIICGIVAGPQDIRDTVRIETGQPEETFGAVIGWLQGAILRHGALAAIGIASFGPLELARDHPHWGYIKSPTKPGWAHVDLAGRVSRTLQLPVAIDTDVNGAALAEHRWGAAQGARVSVYVTVGTGIGGGAIVSGAPLQGLNHPEMGHVRPRRPAADADFSGICAVHGDCLEGLASGPAILKRWGKPLSDLPADHAAHEIIAGYLGQLAVTLQAMMEPGRIIFGGGVLQTPGLLPRIRRATAALGGGYFRGNPDEIIVAPGLGVHAGLLGGLALAMDACRSA